MHLEPAHGLVVLVGLGVGVQRARRRRPAASRYWSAFWWISSTSAPSSAGLLAQGRGPAEVLRQQRDDLVGALAGALLDVAADLEVLAAANRARQHAVGDVADQHVLERELALARQPHAAALRHDDVLLLEAHQRIPACRHRRGPRGRRARPPRRCGRRPPRAARGSARAARASRAARPAGSARSRAARTARRSTRRPAGAPSPRRRTGSRPRARRSPRPRRASASSTPITAATRSRVCSTVSGSSRIDVASWRPPPQRGAAVEQLVARQAKQHQRAAHPLREVLDQVEHPVVGPVDVLEHEHERAGGAPSPSITERTAEKKLSRMRCGSSPSGWRDLQRRLDAEQPPDHGRAPLCAARPAPSRRERHQARRPWRAACPTPARRCRRRRCPASARITSPSAQYTIPDPYGRQRPSRNVGGGWRSASRRSSSCRRRDLPTPAWPITVTRCGRRSRSDALIDGPQQVELVRAPDQRGLARATTRRDRLLRWPGRPPPTPGPARPCPSASAARARWYWIAWLGRTEGALPDRDAARVARRTGDGRRRSPCRRSRCSRRRPRRPRPRRC